VACANKHLGEERPHGNSRRGGSVTKPEDAKKGGKWEMRRKEPKRVKIHIPQGRRNETKAKKLRRGARKGGDISEKLRCSLRERGCKRKQKAKRKHKADRKVSNGMNGMAEGKKRQPGCDQGRPGNKEPEKEIANDLTNEIQKKMRPASWKTCEDKTKVEKSRSVGPNVSNKMLVRK